MPSPLDVPGVPRSQFGQQQLENARQPALRAFHAALGNRFYAPCNVVVMGGSSSEGVGATAFGRGYFPRLRDRLRTLFPVPGVVGGQNYYPAWGAPADGATPAYSWPVTRAGSAGTSNTSGFALKSVALGSGGQSISLTFTGTSFEVWYGKYSGASTFSVTIDGTVAAASVSADAAVDRAAVWSSGALTAGQHTVTVAWVSGSAPVYVRGIMTYNGDETSGLRFYNGAQASVPYATFDTNYLQWQANLQAIQPSLVILQDWNEYTQNIAPAAMVTTILSIIARIRAVCSPSIVLTSGPLIDGTAHTYPWADYQTAFAQVAATDTGGPGGGSGVAFFDLAQRQSSPVTNNGLGLYNSDLLHPSDKGHAMWADALAGFLSPR